MSIMNTHQCAFGFRCFLLFTTFVIIVFTYCSMSIDVIKFHIYNISYFKLSRLCLKISLCMHAIFFTDSSIAPSFLHLIVHCGDLSRFWYFSFAPLLIICYISVHWGTMCNLVGGGMVMKTTYLILFFQSCRACVDQ